MKNCTNAKEKTLNSGIQKLCLTSMLIAVGVLLPQVFHLIGGSAAGGIFLPMHISVIVTGFLIDIKCGRCV